MKNIILVFIFLLTLSLENCDYEENNKNTTVDIIEETRNQSNNIIEFSKYLKKEIDTNFYAQYRMKDDDYVFFYSKDYRIHGSFTPDYRVETKINNECKRFGIKDIWKNDNENFYRFHSNINERKFYQILVLVINEDKFKFPEKSKISKVKYIGNISEIKEPNQAPFIYKINNSIVIYFGESD